MSYFEEYRRLLPREFDVERQGDVSHWMPDGVAQCGPCFNGTRVGVCDERDCQCGCRVTSPGEEQT